MWKAFLSSLLGLQKARMSWLPEQIQRYVDIKIHFDFRDLVFTETFLSACC